MRYLNLTKGFDPFNTTKEECIEFESFFFKGGEPHVKLSGWGDCDYAGNITITSRLNTPNDLMLLLVAKDAIDRKVRYRGVKVSLFIPYFPGGRQDRVMVPGEPLTVKVYADIINSMNFTSVTIFDPHSDVTSALINNCEVIDNYKFVEHSLNDIFNGMEND